MIANRGIPDYAAACFGSEAVPVAMSKNAGFNSWVVPCGALVPCAVVTKTINTRRHEFAPVNALTLVVNFKISRAHDIANDVVVVLMGHQFERVDQVIFRA